MPSDPENHAEYQTWQAADWEELRSIWSALRPISGDEPPTFRSQALTPQQAGWVFERWVMEAFRLDGVSGRYAFDVRSRENQLIEQIDGFLLTRWQGFLVETKFHAEPVDIDPIFRLHLLVERRPGGALGLFFSASGYTGPALESSEHLRPIRVLMFGTADLAWAVQSPGRMMEMVQRKWALAMRDAKPHLPIADFDQSRQPILVPLEFFGQELNDGLSPSPVADGEP